MRKYLLHAAAVASRLLGVVAVLALAGCGGDNGGSVARLRGSLTKSAPISMSDADVKAYLLADLQNPVKAVKADANGRYILELPDATIGRDVLIVATKTVMGVTTTRTVRLEALACDLASRDVSGVDLDSATTAGAEVALATMKKDTAHRTDLDGPAVYTIVRELTDWSEIDQVPVQFPNNAMLGDDVASGVKDGTALATFIAGNSTIQEALKNLFGTGNTSVKDAKAFMQWVRDAISTVAWEGNDLANGLQGAVNEQVDLFNTEAHLVATFEQKTRFALKVPDLIENHEPGRYTYANEVFMRLGSSADGKSWSVIDGRGTTVTITPDAAMSKFTAKEAAGKRLTVTAVSTNDAAFKVDGTVAVGSDAQGRLNGLTLALTVRDSSLTSPITFKGTLSATAVTDDSWSRGQLSGSFTSQWGSAEVTNASVVWATSSDDDQPQSLQIESLRASSSLSKPAMLTASGISVQLEAPDPANHIEDPTPKSAAIGSLSLTASSQKVALSNAAITMTRYAEEVSPGQWDTTVLPKTVKGTLHFEGTTLESLDGSLNASWDNPANNLKLGTSPASDYPKGTLTVSGNARPKFGVPMSLDIAITSDNTVTNGTVSTTVKLNTVNGLGGQVGGTIVMAYPVGAGNVIQDELKLTVSLTHSPSGQKLALAQQPGGNPSGTITTGSGTKVADIGPASSLGLPDLGSVLIVKYIDGTFETLASLDQ